jgi:hypothetical protein
MLASNHDHLELMLFSDSIAKLPQLNDFPFFYNAFTIPSITFLASPNTIMVLSI